MANPRVAVIVGSNRRESINRKLAQALARLGAGTFEARFVRIDNLPMYNQDNEGNPPAETVRFKDELARADGVIVVTPEHDRSIPAVLKNAVDWGARPYGKNSWAGKPAFITGASPGAIGSALAQQHLRNILISLGVILMGGDAYITFKPNLIDADGNIGDEGTRKFLQDFVNRLPCWSRHWRRKRRGPRRSRNVDRHCMPAIDGMWRMLADFLARKNSLDNH
jgi:chromate reductase, NAD(P)H dehydrogenase (quinone)